MSAMVRSSPFSRAAVAAMRKIYPEGLADKSFDNTGLLLEAPFNRENRLRNSVLLTIDLTSAVADEAIGKKCSVVVSYHPIIFRGLKNLTLANSQQTSLLRLAREGISVYSPHTAVDAALGGNADWLADIVTGSLYKSRMDTKLLPHSTEETSHGSTLTRVYEFANAIDPNYSLVKLASIAHDRSIIEPSSVDSGTGMGRITRFKTPRPLSSILEVLALYFGEPLPISLAVPQGSKTSEIEISSVGICAGSGGSMLGGLDNVDLLLTGELSHHETLAAIESGKSVICLRHSNSERGYLTAVMRQKLKSALQEEWDTLRASEKSKATEDMKEAYTIADVAVEISEKDADPFRTAVIERR